MGTMGRCVRSSGYETLQRYGCPRKSGGKFRDGVPMQKLK